MGILGDMARRDLTGGKRKEDEQADSLDLDGISGNADTDSSKETRTYEEGKLAAIETATSILNRLKVAENNLTQSREEKDLISFLLVCADS